MKPLLSITSKLLSTGSVKFIRQNYRIYPNKHQKEVLNQWIGNARFVWNYFLAKNIESYESSKKFIFHYEMTSFLPSMKKSEEFNWLSLSESTSLQQKLKDLDSALKQSFKKSNTKKGFPKFKSKHTDISGIKITMGFGINENGKLKLPKLDSVKIKYHTPLKGKPKSITVIKDRVGYYFVSFVVEINEIPEVFLSDLDVRNSIGIDVGIKSFMVSSKGEFIENPKFLKKSEKKLKKTPKTTQ